VEKDRRRPDDKPEQALDRAAIFIARVTIANGRARGVER